MSSLGSPNPFFIAGKKAYEVDRSLRLDGISETRLNNTPSSDGNRKKWTWAAWIKRGVIDRRYLWSAYTSGPNVTSLQFHDNGQLNFEDWLSGYRFRLRTAGQLRDPNAWYHLVVYVDTAQSTASDRVKMYINGVEPEFDATNYPTQNLDTKFNTGGLLHAIGTEGTNQRLWFDGLIAEVYFLDGYAYDPSYFGETNLATGQWVPKKYIGSFGSNGYYLNFSDNSSSSALGTDFSGNGNNFTPVNFNTGSGIENSDSVVDTPTNNFCIMNPTDKHSTMGTRNSNFQVIAGGGWHGIKGSFGVNSGKWYYELKTTNPNIFCGWAADDLAGTNNISTNPQDSNSAMSAGVLIFCDDGKYHLDTGGSSNRINYSSALSANDVLGCAIDLDNNTAQFYKNGTALGSINISSSKLATKMVMPYFIPHFASETYSFEFGQHGFNYTPPTGYKALSSANLPNPTILDPTKHFETLLYTGNGGSHSVTGLEFQPDWLWIKNRGQTDNHQLHDAIRGVSKGLISNLSNAEYTDVNAVTAFNSNGFSMNNNYDSHNKSSETYVAWNWNAGNTDGKTYAVTVVSDSGNKYRFDGFGTSAVTLDLAEGGTYIFDQSDSSNSGHPLRFSTTSNGTHGGGSEYTTGVTTAGTPGSSGAYTQIVVAASAPTLYYYCSVHSGMGGQANTNSTLGSSNFDGNIQSTVKANASAGFSIVTYTGNGSGGSGARIGHGLGVAPKMVIVKNREAAQSWELHAFEEIRMYLNSTDGDFADAQFSLTSTDIRPANNNARRNENGTNYVAYVFSDVSSYSKFGSYTGNGDADGTFIYIGFRPAFLILKRSSNTGHWYIYDNKRNTSNVADLNLKPSGSAAEATFTTVDFVSNGFKIRTNNSAFNTNGDTYIYLAFAEFPFKNARAR
jgi:hypothetical protein